MAQASGAPYPLVFGDTTYLMSPLTAKDIDEVTNVLRSSYVRMVRESFTADMSVKDRETELAVAMRQARKIDWLSPEGSELLGSLDGMCLIIFQGVKRNHPLLDFSAFKQDMLRPVVEGSSQRRVELAMKEWAELNGDNREETGGPKKDEPAPAPASG